VRRPIGIILLSVACVASAVTSAGGLAQGCRGPELHTQHDVTTGHRYMCRFKVVGSTIVSKAAGLGNIEFRKDLGAIVQRDEGVVAILDMANPKMPKTVGRYSDDAQDAFDGDLAFSHDAQFLFYARQTHQFSRDGVHVLNVSDPSAPSLSFYLASGGTLEVAYYYDGTDEWVVFLDAVDGLVVTRFVRETGALVEVFRDPEPVTTKVGGPASAGLHIDASDPQSERPLLYVSTGGSGLQIYDFTDPTTPALLGAWSEVGLADIVVRATARERVVYAATEYWFEKTLKPQVIVLDAGKPDAIKKARVLSLRLPAEDMWRVQGMTWRKGKLLVAHSHAGLVELTPRGRVRSRALLGGSMNEAAEPPPTEQMGLRTSAYAMDVEARGRYVYLTDAATGALHVLRPTD
jgi:hypothetical protein